MQCVGPTAKVAMAHSVACHRSFLVALSTARSYDPSAHADTAKMHLT